MNDRVWKNIQSGCHAKMLRFLQNVLKKFFFLFSNKND